MELCMSQRERDRLKVVEQLKKGCLKQQEVAALLGLTTRQVRRILRRYEKEGDKGLVHRLRNRTSNRKIPDRLRRQVLGRIKKRYGDFGPTLVSEYLDREEGIGLSRETLRRWMSEEGLWRPRRARVRHRQWRQRKACFGELVQLDSSIHDWFEGRGEAAVLVAMIDDATSRLFARFFPSDTTTSNMQALRMYLRRYGRPVAIYADKASHFHTTRSADLEEKLQGRAPETQIGRALRELGIRYIRAHSPQAKGRVERCFGTAQDRLIKGMRLEGISRIAEANRYLEGKFLREWTRRWSVKPARAVDVHRRIAGFDLKAILSVQESRVVANDYTVRYERGIYQIERAAVRRGLRGSKVVVEKRLDGGLRLRWRGKYLRYRRVTEEDGKKQCRKAPTPVGLRPPSVGACAKSRIPAPDHPWRKRTILSCRKPDISTLR